MTTAAVQILWDESHLWGLMAFAAMRGFGVPCRLISAKDIAHGCLFRKPPKVLVVPGGNARQKARALGGAGRDAIRAWLAQGGVYLGFCGGAGLALAQAKPEDGLGICAWRRASYGDRLAHLLSGHVLAQSCKGLLALPVWWPGRFESAGETEILASYHAPAEDLWLGDKPLSSRPEAPVFPEGQPLAIRGCHGRGSYILSYAHLETPASPHANAWLAEILQAYGVGAARNQTGEWRVLATEDRQGSYQDACWRLQEIMASQASLGRFFRRTPWLYGWRQGLPGMICNYLLADLAELAQAGTNRLDRQVENLLNDFLGEAEAYFQTLRLEEVADPGLEKESVGRRDRVFGHPMLGGGMAAPVLARLADLIIQNQRPV